MSLSKPDQSGPPPKKRKVDRENRSFQQRWEEEYFFTHDREADKPVCLVCGFTPTVKKEFNLRRHYSKLHEAQLKVPTISQAERLAKLFDLKLKFMNSKQQADDAGTSSQSHSNVSIYPRLHPHSGERVLVFCVTAAS